jgi:hypothetical protein
MRRLLKVAAWFLVVLISFGAGAMTAAIYHLGSPIVTVRLENVSTQSIVSMELKHE